MGNAPAPSGSTSWAPQAWATLLVAMAAASAVFWVLQIAGLTSGATEMRFTPPQPEPGLAPASLARALGAPDTPVDAPSAAQSRMTLVAVMGSGQQGVALIALDDRKAEAYAVGAPVQARRYVVRLGLRSAELGPSPQGPVTETLTLPVPRLPTESK